MRLGNRGEEASTLGQLGNLYSARDRLEESVQFFRQALAVFVDLEDRANEGRTRSNIADKLIRLNLHAEAREELERAIECNRPFGHAAEPWKTFHSLSELEHAVGNAPAAAAARAQAVQAYLAYRRDGGENQNPGGRLAALVAQAISENEIDAATDQLGDLLERPDPPAYLRALIPALQSILTGTRDPGLAADPSLYFDDAAEILLLLETMA